MCENQNGPSSGSDLEWVQDLFNPGTVPEIISRFGFSMNEHEQVDKE